jgi:secondary thiamine-phosphate synthase enzyme
VLRTVPAMKCMASTLTVPTRDRLEIQDLTDRIASLPGVDEITHGFVLIQSLHTTASLFINEYQDALLHDITAFLRRLVPEDEAYRHNDPAYSDCSRGNAWSHLAALLLHTALHVPIEQGRLVLGTWQRILFCELDGPQTRQIYAQVMGV